MTATYNTSRYCLAALVVFTLIGSGCQTTTGPISGKQRDRMGSVAVLCPGETELSLKAAPERPPGERKNFWKRTKQGAAVGATALGTAGALSGPYAVLAVPAGVLVGGVAGAVTGAAAGAIEDSKNAEAGSRSGGEVVGLLGPGDIVALQDAAKEMDDRFRASLEKKKTELPGALFSVYEPVDPGLKNEDHKSQLILQWKEFRLLADDELVFLRGSCSAELRIGDGDSPDASREYTFSSHSMQPAMWIEDDCARFKKELSRFADQTAAGVIEDFFGKRG